MGEKVPEKQPKVVISEPPAESKDESVKVPPRNMDAQKSQKSEKFSGERKKDEKVAFLEDDSLQEALAGACRWTFGVVAAEVWILNYDNTKLLQPRGGFYVDPVYLGGSPSQALNRIFHKNSPGYVPVEPLAIGEGLAGNLITDFGFSAKAGKKKKKKKNPAPTKKKKKKKKKTPPPKKKKKKKKKKS